MQTDDLVARELTARCKALVDKMYYKRETELAEKYSKFGPWKQSGRIM